MKQLLKKKKMIFISFSAFSWLTNASMSPFPHHSTSEPSPLPPFFLCATATALSTKHCSLFTVIKDNHFLPERH